MKEIWPQGWETAGHYAPGMVSGGMLYVSGQLPIDKQTGKLVEGGVAAQGEMALNNLDAVLTAAGLTRQSVVMCRVYVPDVCHWDEVNQVYAAFFGDHKPARVIVPTRALHHNALVEIEAIAQMEE